MLSYRFPLFRYSAFGRWLAERRLRKHRSPLPDVRESHEGCWICREAYEYLVSIGHREAPEGRWGPWQTTDRRHYHDGLP